MAQSQQLNIGDRNTELPFFPSENWDLLEADKGNITLPTFNWIQAFYDVTQLSATPELAVWSGNNDVNGNPIVNRVRFPFSGAMIPFKGKAIFSSGTNIRGQTVTSAPIGNTPTTDLLKVVAWGGMY